MPEGDSFRTNSDLFSNHYLDDHLPETEDWTSVPDEEIEQAFEEIREEYEKKEGRLEGWNERRLQRRFINPVLDIIGFSYAVEETVSRGQRTPDYGFFSDEAALADADQRGDAGEDFYANAVAVGDAKRWDRPLDTQGERRRDFENPSFQIHVYLQETPARWAILTNGRKWRLYHESTSHRIDSYYEVDLPAVLEADDLETFRYFYLFFQKAAFVEDGTGTSFLDNVYEESNIFAQDLGEDLQDNIYEAIKLLAEGFLEYPDNDLSRDDLDLIHDSALIYLYRVIFVLYAEAEGRDLLDTDNRTYKDEFSLNLLKQKVAKKLDKPEPGYLNSKDRLWSHLQDLFELIDQGSRAQGISEEKLHVPAYNGGLFRTDPDETDSDEARFLAEHRVGDAYLARVIDLLTRSENGADEGKTFVDYSSLDIRHLGSIYEGILEYKLRVADEPLTLDDGEYVPVEGDDDVAVESGEVYLMTGSGERKATGSYYTPEYIVEYIVENTLGPLVEEIREELFEEVGHDDPGFAEEFAERVFELKVLDPAMGSGHFLTNAVDFLAREIIHAQERQAEQQGVESIDQSHDIYWARRQVAQRCIYGVDLNPLAVELAKVSLWLRTLAAEQPLAFLDHHLKTGNSLVGSDIEEVLAENGSNGDGGQLTLRDSFDRTRQEVIEHVMERFQDLLAIDNETLDEIKHMEDVYQEVRQDPLYRHLLAMANVHTAEAFGLDVPEDAYEGMARALRDDAWDEIEDEPWFEDAQATAKTEHFFHWALEFPVAFYDADGSRKIDGGFDSIVGNPPYVRIQNVKKSNPRMVSYLNAIYRTTHQNYDLAVPFTELGYNLLDENGSLGFIETKKWIQGEYGENLRRYLIDRKAIKELVDFGDQQVFPGASTYTVLLFLDRDSTDEFCYAKIYELREKVGQLLRIEQGDTFVSDDMYHYTESFEHFDEEPWVFTRPGERGILTYLDQYPTLKSVADTVFVGLQTSADPVYIVEVRGEHDGSLEVYSKELDQTVTIEKEVTKPVLRGGDISKWTVTEYENRVIFPYTTDLESESYALMSEERLKGDFPDTWGYLCQNKSRLLDRADVEQDRWWGYPYPKNLEKFDAEKLMTQVLSNEASFSLDQHGDFAFVGGGTAGGYGITVNGKIKPKALLALLNSSLLDWALKKESSQFRGGYYSYAKRYLEKLPICLDRLGSSAGALVATDQFTDKSVEDVLCDLVTTICRAVEEYRRINTRLPDYLGNYDWGPTLHAVQGHQPAPGVGDTSLTDTAEDLENLRIGRVAVSQEDQRLIVSASARFKPDNESSRRTDRWGYTETEIIPAMEFVGLSEEERALVTAFVPYAVEKGEGFAGFRETATKTNSLVDRLEAITLPDPDDVADDLDRYLEAKRRADELDENIEKTDALIDEIVYELYGLDEEEIEIVEGAVGGE